MRPKQTQDSDLLARLTEVFRGHGYDGATLSLLAEASGLQRASLYHRFPGGKEEMALAVLARADEFFADRVLGPLEGAGDPRARAAAAAAAMAEFYQGGGKSCLLEVLSVAGAEPSVRECTRRSLGAVLGGLRRVAEDAGHPSGEATRRAEDTLARLHGALVMARVTGDPGPFRRSLAEMPDLLASP